MVSIVETQNKKKPDLIEVLRSQSVEEPKIIQEIKKSKTRTVEYGRGDTPYSSTDTEQVGGYTSVTGEDVQILKPKEDKKFEVYETPPTTTKEIIPTGNLIPVTPEEKEKIKGSQLDPYTIVPPSTIQESIEAGITGSKISQGLGSPTGVFGYISPTQRQEAQEVSGYTQQIIDIQTEFNRNPESFIGKEGVKFNEKEIVTNEGITKVKEIEITSQFYEANIKKPEKLKFSKGSFAAGFGLGVLKGGVFVAEGIASIPFEATVRQYNKPINIKSEKILGKIFGKDVDIGIQKIKTAPIGISEATGIALPVAYIVAKGSFKYGSIIKQSGFKQATKQLIASGSFYKPTNRIYIQQLGITEPLGLTKIKNYNNIPLTYGVKAGRGLGGAKTDIFYTGEINNKIFGVSGTLTEQKALYVGGSGTILEEGSFKTLSTSRFKTPITDTYGRVVFGKGRINIDIGEPKSYTETKVLSKDSTSILFGKKGTLKGFKYSPKKYRLTTMSAFGETRGRETKYIAGETISKSYSAVEFEKYKVVNNIKVKMYKFKPTTTIKFKPQEIGRIYDTSGTGINEIKTGGNLQLKQKFKPIITSQAPLQKSYSVSRTEQKTILPKININQVEVQTPKQNLKQKNIFTTRESYLVNAKVDTKIDVRFISPTKLTGRQSYRQQTPQKTTFRLTEGLISKEKLTPQLKLITKQSFRTPNYKTPKLNFGGSTTFIPPIYFGGLDFSLSPIKRKKGYREYFRTPSIISRELNIYSKTKGRFEEFGISSRPILT